MIYTSNVISAWSESTAIEDLVQFVDEFYTTYPTFTKNDLYVFGESYAGHYVPDLVHSLLFRPNRGADSALATVIRNNLKGMGIGNGLTSEKALYSTIGTFAAASTHEKLKNVVNDDDVRDCNDMIEACQVEAYGGHRDCSEVGMYHPWLVVDLHVHQHSICCYQILIGFS
jgi:carboxypeptidase C (cathepsin A)